MKLFDNFLLYVKKIKRARRIKFLKSPIAPYLQKDFGVELNYKLWPTKGARFSASYRNKIQHELSGKTVSYLSAYIIIVSVLSVYKFEKLSFIDDKMLSFTLTSLSILILIFSQFESSKEYAIKSEKFHQCSLEIGKLYNRLRMIKTFNSIKNKEKEISKISRKYDQILDKYENHNPIDLKYFKITKSEYHKLSSFDVYLIKLSFYLLVKFKYHFFIYFPIILFILVLFKII